MIWLLAIFRALGIWMKRAGLVTGNTDKDRRVFLQAFLAIGGAALFRDVPAPAPDMSMPVVNIKTFAWFKNPGLKHDVIHNDYSQSPPLFVKQEEVDALMLDERFSQAISFTFDGMFARDVQ